MALLKWLVIAAAMFGGLVLVMYLLQRSLLYHPERQRTLPAAVGLPDAQEIVLDTIDSEQVIVWYIPAKANKPLVLYFQGNAGALRNRADRFRALAGDGTGVVALSYRGYGGSTGSPTEQGLIADAEAAYAFAAVHVTPERIAIWGESLGTGVGVALAATHKVGRVVLESPFTSAADVGARVYWYLPVQRLMKDPFRSDARIGRVTAPLLVLHGSRDTIVPIALGERLFAKANEPKRFVRFAEGHHHDLDDFGALDAVRAFIAEITPQSPPVVPP